MAPRAQTPLRGEMHGGNMSKEDRGGAVMEEKGKTEGGTGKGKSGCVLTLKGGNKSFNEDLVRD